METQPQVVIIGGPNGAGKSTFASTLVAAMGISEFVNPDIIARGLSALQPESVAFESARLLRNRLEKLTMLRADFAFETTLSARTYAPWIRELQQQGWRFRLIFVTLQSADVAVERVRVRVAQGGHRIPEEDVRRRFARGIANFHRLYSPLADSWLVYDNTLPGGSPRLIAWGERGQPADIIDTGLWQRFCEHGNASA